MISAALLACSGAGRKCSNTQNDRKIQKSSETLQSLTVALDRWESQYEGKDMKEITWMEEKLSYKTIKLPWALWKRRQKAAQWDNFRLPTDCHGPSTSHSKLVQINNCDCHFTVYPTVLKIRNSFFPMKVRARVWHWFEAWFTPIKHQRFTTHSPCVCSSGIAACCLLPV